MTNYRYWMQITSSCWSFVFAILGQMTYLVTDLTPDCARSWISLMELSGSFLMAIRDMVDASDVDDILGGILST
nr:hypothetical protein [Tanacetum cinerariifolium]